MLTEHHSNGKHSRELAPLDRTDFVVHSALQLFKNQEASPVLKAPEMTDEAWASIKAKQHQIAIDRQVLKGLILKHASDKEVVLQAQTSYEADLDRAQNLALATKGLAAIWAWTKDAKKLLRHEIRARDHHSRNDRVLMDRTVEWQTKSMIVIILWILGSFGILSLGLFSELSSATYTVMNAGLGFEGQWIRSILFVIPIIFAPFTALKFLEKTIPARYRSKYFTIMNGIASPLAILLVGLFSLILGNAMHVDVNLFAPEPASANPPLWVLLTISMLCLALMVTQLSYFLTEGVFQLVAFKPVENLVYQNHATEVSHPWQEINKTKAPISLLISVIKSHRAQRQEYISKYLAEFELLKQEIQSKQSQCFLS